MTTKQQVLETLENILLQAQAYKACVAQFRPYKKAMETQDYVLACQIVLGNKNWLIEQNIDFEFKSIHKVAQNIAISYYENGNIDEKCSYNSKGVIVGDYVRFYENGNIYEQCTYNSKGVRVGDYLRYYENGNIDEQCTYNSKGEVQNDN